MIELTDHPNPAASDCQAIRMDGRVVGYVARAAGAPITLIFPHDHFTEEQLVSIRDTVATANGPAKSMNFPPSAEAADEDEDETEEDNE